MARPVPYIENVVAAARLGGPFDIAGLARRLKGSEYHPDRFAGLVVHVPEGSALVFEDGTIITTGARGVEEALAQMEHVRTLLGQAGADTTGVEGFTVRNIVLSLDLGKPIPLAPTALAFPGEDLTYDAERFPGLVVHWQDPKVTLIAFASGRIVATGSGDLPAVEEALGGFVSALEQRELVVTG